MIVSPTSHHTTSASFPVLSNSLSKNNSNIQRYASCWCQMPNTALNKPMKDEDVHVRAIEACGECRDTAPFILNLDTRLAMSGYYIPPAALTRGKKAVIHWRGSQGCPELSWTFRNTNNLLSLPGFELRTIMPVAQSVVSIQDTLPQLPK
jgi:hypothetical protein